MKALTILQPWASLIVCGAKKIETRSWATKYRGPIAIHAAKSFPSWLRKITYRDPFHSALFPNMTPTELAMDGYQRSFLLPLGEVIAVAELVDCREIYGRTCVGNERNPIGALLRNDAHGIEVTGNEIAFGDYTPGRYAWVLENVRAIQPVPAKGMQGLWNW